jgi:hypothetical protein
MILTEVSFLAAHNRSKMGAHCHCQFDGIRAAVLMLLSAEMTLPAVRSDVCEGISIAIIRSILAAVTVVASASIFIGLVEGRGSKSEIFGSHHFVHRRSRLARDNLGWGHNRLLIAVRYIN